MKTPTIDVDLFHPAVIQDPFPVYEHVRATGRVVWSESLKAWLVTGFDDCNAVLTDGRARFAVLNGNPEYTPWFPAPNMIMVDGLEHDRLRRPLSPLFTRTFVARWEERVGAVVDRLLSPLAVGGSHMDLITDFTMIPTVIVAEMLGVPEERHEDFRRWSHTIVSGHSYGREDPGTFADMRRAGRELNDYLTDEIDRHRREKHDDLISAMLQLDDVMTEGEIRSAAILLLAAGYDTTAQLLSTALVVLERHPDQRRLVAGHQSLVSNMIEEVLRWVGVTQLIPRGVVTDTTVAGVELKQGDMICAIPPAAGRDPSRWSDPNRFDVQRQPRSHFGFGFGPHLCLGAPLARLETKVALSRLLAIAPDYRLRELEYGTSLFARGPVRGTIEVNTVASG